MFGGNMYAGAPFAGTRLAGQAFTKTLTETVTNVDSINLLKAFFKQLNETVTNTDTFTRIYTGQRTLSDTQVSSDILQRLYTGRRTFTETITSSASVVPIALIPNPRIRIDLDVADTGRIDVQDDKSRKSRAKIDNVGDLRIFLKK